MLTAEQARKTLEGLHHEDWFERRRSAARKLPPRLRGIAEYLLGPDPDDPSDNDEQATAEAHAGKQLDALPTGERVKVFAALFPGLGPQVDAGWELGKRLPYQGHMGRKAFRAPSDLAATRERRLQWVSTLLRVVGGYEQDIRWLAAWAPHLSHYGGAETVGVLLAATIDRGGADGDAVFEILCDSARGEHEVGAMGRHVTRALLAASRPEGWEFIERMLLAAQRQEGLRQTILESIDEAHPEAFRRMLRLIREHDLARFSATVRALDVWFGYMWDAVSVRVVNRVLDQVLRCLEDPQARARDLASDDGETVYLALWSLAFEDALAALPEAVKLLEDPHVERRFAAVHLLGQLDLPAARLALRPALADTDLRVALHALEQCRSDFHDDDDAVGEGDLFERVEALLERVPEKRLHLEPILWPWEVFTADRQSLAGELVGCLGKRPPTRLLPYLPLMHGYSRAHVVHLLASLKKWDAATRDTLFALVGDSHAAPREAALKALAHCKVTEQEAQKLEELLTRKADDLRRGVLTLLLAQKDPAALASADRLLASGALPQRLAGLELLRQMAEAGREAAACRARGERFRSERPRLAADEEKRLVALLDTDRTAATLDDALGLMNPAERTRPQPPRKRPVAFLTAAALACLKSLDDLVHQHRETPITYDSWEGPKEEPLGSIEWGFPSPEHDVPLERDVARLPLREVWEAWWAERPRSLRDRDGLELLRAQAWIERDDCDWEEWKRKKAAGVRQAMAALSGDQDRRIRLRYESIVADLLQWLLRLHPPAGAVDFLLDAMEASFALVPSEELTRQPKEDAWNDPTWRDEESPFRLWQNLARASRLLLPADWEPEHHVRLYRLLRWLDEPAPGMPRLRPELEEVVAAMQAGGATEADLLDQILGPSDAVQHARGFDDLWELTRRPEAPVIARYPFLRALLDRCRQRILEVELARGEAPTAATLPALQLQSVEGVEILVRLLHALGDAALKRGYNFGNLGRVPVLSHLLRVCYPGPSEAPQAVADRLRAEGFSEKRLIELAFFAPQWVQHVEAYLGWEQFAEGVWWFLAHTREGGVTDSDEAWTAWLSERTALTAEELEEGAVDVAWFRRVYSALGPKRWAALDEAAKYASRSHGYKRAQFLADVLLGKARKATLVADVRTKRRREAVRALGLLPLAEGAARERDLLDRYQVLQEYLRYARQLGAMSKESAVRTARIGVENLARTAGYPDPIRFEWAMEAEAVVDLARGPAVVTIRGVDVTLALDAGGQPELTARRGDKVLKSLPPEARQHARVKELLERRTELKRQASRIRQSLEQMMCRGETITGSELRQLFAHPMLAPLLERLVLVGEGIMGYPVAGGQALRNHAGQTEPVQKGETIRLAHPHDLLAGKEWHRWQHECFTAERVQPFKQVFRELYVLTGAERRETASRRYAGQQVNPQQAMALWGSRGWLAGEEEGVRRTFHEAGLTVWVTFLGGYFTPAEVEGWTIEEVRFARRGEDRPLKLAEVPPRLFSEVMRDLDLVVSVAHRGGVDPEASASTVEMRATLLRETCALMKLTNVRIKGSHVHVAGTLGNYVIHLGSAVVHRQPGGHLCLVPVHAQHRGRLFLPFADDDPKTAEVISKVLLLARDTEIRDPNILDQLRAGN